MLLLFYVFLLTPIQVTASAPPQSWALIIIIFSKAELGDGPSLTND